MPSLPIPYGASLSSGVDELADGTAAPVVMNLVVDQAGVIHQRPGLETYQDTGTVGNILGHYVWGDYDVYVTSDRSIYALSLVTPNTVLSLSDSTAATKLDGSLRPVFANTADTLIIVGGGVPQKWTGSGLSARLGGSPPVATHVTIIGQRVVVNLYDNSGRFRYSDLGAGSIETWPLENVQEAEAKPDKLMGMYENTRSLWAFGASTVQVYGVSPDPLVPYSPTSTVNVGTLARYSPIQTDEGYAWLDDRRRFVHSDGQGFEDISLPWISKTVSQLDTVSDAIGFRFKINSLQFLVWVLPAEGRTFAYEMNGKRWSEWAGFSSGEFQDWPVTGYSYDSARNLHLASVSTGEGICQLSTNAFSDLGVNLVGNIRTGFENRDTDNAKHVQRDTYTLRRGVGTFSGTPSSMEVRHRDDLGTWSSWRRFSLGTDGDYTTRLTDYGTIGQYYRRQHELRYSGPHRLSIIEARETFQITENS